MGLKSNYQRFRKHFRDRGFFYALWRGIKYFIYLIRRYRVARNLRIRKKAIKNKDIEIVCFSKEIKIFYKGKEITKDVGLNTSLIIKGNCLISPQAKWKVKLINPSTLYLCIKWRKLPILQNWEIKIVSPDKIVWMADIEIKKEIKVEERKASIMISPEYKRWINSFEEGFFPLIRNWEEIDLKLKDSKFIGARSLGKKDLPALIYDFSQNYYKSFPSIQNTDKANFAHVLNVCMKEMDYKKGKYSYFKGEILIIENEQMLEDRLERARKELVKSLPLNKKEKFKVALVNLPWQNNGHWGVRAGSRWPHIKTEEENHYQPFPFFLAYAAALLKENNFQVYLIDCLAQKMTAENLKNKLERICPHLLVAETSTPSLENDLEILRQLKGDLLAALCGPELTIRNITFLEKNPFIDFVLVGEYELTLLELIKNLKENKTLKNILGLNYRENGEIKINPPRPLIKELDSLPWPLRENLPMEAYIDAPGEIPLPSVQMWASRGCPFQCTFCLWPQLMYQANLYRVRNPIKVVDEMEYLIKGMGFKSIYFDDDTFNVVKERVLEICRHIRKRKLKIPWAIMARPDLMDKEILSVLKKSGLWAVKYGVESAEQRLVDNTGKKMDLEKSIEMIRLTKRLRIKTHLTFMLGLPGETEESIRKTINLAIDLAPFSLQFSLATPFPGTDYFDYLESRAKIGSYNWSEYDGNYRCVVKAECVSPAKLEEFKRLALRIWKDYQRGILSYAEVCKILS
jgi:radical SAM superfamily enzyme YgiQ (UPF0313 family)